MGPDGGELLVGGALVSLEQQLEVPLAEEALHQVQVQTRHSGPIHRQDLVSYPEA